MKMFTDVFLHCLSGLSYQVDAVKLTTTGAPDCPRCGTRVYFMEQMLASGKSWHKKCFTCGKYGFVSLLVHQLPC